MILEKLQSLIADQLGKEYYYSQLIILKDKASADKFMKKCFELLEIRNVLIIWLN